MPVGIVCQYFTLNGVGTINYDLRLSLNDRFYFCELFIFVQYLLLSMQINKTTGVVVFKTGICNVYNKNIVAKVLMTIDRRNMYFPFDADILSGYSTCKSRGLSHWQPIGKGFRDTIRLSPNHYVVSPLFKLLWNPLQRSIFDIFNTFSNSEAV